MVDDNTRKTEIFQSWGGVSCENDDDHRATA